MVDEQDYVWWPLPDGLCSPKEHYFWVSVYEVAAIV